jgi:hypothetical protein
LHELRDILVDPQLIFEQSGGEHAKLHEISVLLKAQEHLVDHPEPERVVFPNLYLLPPEYEVGLRGSVQVAEKSVF